MYLLSRCAATLHEYYDLGYTMLNGVARADKLSALCKAICLTGLINVLINIKCVP